MKKKVLLIAICLFLSISRVYAADDYTIEEMSPSNYSITIEAGHTAGASMKMTFQHPDEDASMYYTYFVKTQSSPRINIEDNLTLDHVLDPKKVGNTFWNNKINMVSGNSIYMQDEWYLAKDYEWAYIIYYKFDSQTRQKTYKITSTPLEVKHPELPSITERYQIFIFNNNTSTGSSAGTISIFPYFPHKHYSDTEAYGEHKLITKIGVVKDTNILKHIRDSKSGAYSELLTYAKSDQELKSWTYDDNTNSTYRIPLDGFNVTNGQYYYLYTTFTDSDGLYRNLDGISLAMAHNSLLTTKLVWDNLGEADPVESTSSKSSQIQYKEEEYIENPKTGTVAIIFVWAIGVGIIIYSVWYFRRYYLKNSEQ